MSNRPESRFFAPGKSGLSLLKVLISIALLTAIAAHIDGDDLLAALTTMPLWAVIGAVLSSLASVLLTSCRWQAVLDLMRCKVGLRHLMRLTMIGFFFNQALPSTIGGDAVRIVLAKEEGLSTTIAIRSILIERLLALCVVLAMCLTGLPWLLLKLGLGEQFLAILVVVGGSVTAIILIVSFNYLPRTFRGRLTTTLGEFAGDFMTSIKRLDLFHKLWGVSLLSQVFACLTVWVLATGLQLDVSLLQILAITPTIFLLLMVPISIGGWGLREGLMVMGLGLLGIEASDALAVSLILGLVHLLASLPGGLFWLIRTKPELATGYSKEG